MKLSFKVSQCHLRHGSAQKTRTKKKQTTHNKQTCWTSVSLTSPHASLSTLHHVVSCEVMFFFTWILSESFPSESLWSILSVSPLNFLMIFSRAALAEAGWRVEKIFRTPIFVWPTLFSLSHPNQTGGGKNGVMPTQPVTQTGNYLSRSTNTWDTWQPIWPPTTNEAQQKGQINIKQILWNLNPGFFFCIDSNFPLFGYMTLLY